MTERLAIAAWYNIRLALYGTPREHELKTDAENVQTYKEMERIFGASTHELFTDLRYHMDQDKLAKLEQLAGPHGVTMYKAWKARQDA